MRMFILKNYSQESVSMILVSMFSLQMLMKQNPGLFAEFVELCRNPDYKLSDTSRKNLETLNFIRNGAVNTSLRNIVLSAVEGNGLEMRLIFPVAA